MPAVIRASFYGGSETEPAGVSAELGVSLDRSDSQAGSEPVLLPETTPGTSYSALKQVALEVITAASPPTTLHDATVRARAAMPPGVAWFYRANGTYGAQISNPGTLTADAAAGADTIESSVAYAVDSYVQIDVDPFIELRQVTAVSGSTLTLDRPLLSIHPAGALLMEFTSAAPPDASTETGGNPAVPAGYTLPTVSPVIYSALGVSGATLGRVGPFVYLVGALSSTYARIWLAHGTVRLPSLIMGYDES